MTFGTPIHVPLRMNCYNLYEQCQQKLVIIAATAIIRSKSEVVPKFPSASAVLFVLNVSMLTRQTKMVNTTNSIPAKQLLAQSTAVPKYT